LPVKCESVKIGLARDGAAHCRKTAPPDRIDQVVRFSQESGHRRQSDRDDDGLKAGSPFGRAVPNKQNAGELLIVAFFESRFGKNHSGNCWNHCKPAIA
jgi:hypothetical protein